MASLKYFVGTVVITLLFTAASSHVKRKFTNKENTDNDFELFKNLEIEKLKSKILKQLGLSEPPTISDSLAKLSVDIIQILVGDKEEEPPKQNQNKLVDLMILPTNSDFRCQQHNTSSFCQRFEYLISPDAIPSPSELWIRKLKPLSENVTISVSCSQLEKNTVVEHEEFPNENGQVQWVFYNISTIENFKFWKGDTTCALEVEGILIDENERNLPFLKMMRDTETHIRRKKTEDGTEAPSTCVLIPFNISFAELGFEDWIEHPHEYQANMCYGECRNVRNHHEYLMSKVFEKDHTVEKEYGCLKTCCRPKEYAPLKMIYRNSNNTIENKYFVDMIVLSCSCS